MGESVSRRGLAYTDRCCRPGLSAYQSNISNANGTTYFWDIEVGIDPTGTTLNIAATLADHLGNSHTSTGTVSDISTLQEFGDWIGFGSRPGGGTATALQFDQASFAVIPEPSSLALLAGFGALGVGLLRRRLSC